MPTISANASSQITIPAGQRLRFLIGGAGVGQLAAANGFDGQFIIGPAEQMIGPFPSDRVFRVSCTQAVTYQLQAPPFDQYLSNGNSVVSQDANGNQYANGSPVSGGGNQLLTAAAAGATTGWINGLASPERFAVTPTGITGTASITIDRSADGATAYDTLGTLSLTSADNGKSCYTPPISVGLPYVRITVTADGGGTHNVTRGA